MEELIFFISIPVLRDRSSDDEVDDVCVPGGVTRDGKEIVDGNVSPTSSPPEMWRRDSAVVKHTNVGQTKFLKMISQR